MENRSNEISKLVSNREEKRAINRRVLTDAIGYKNLEFISNNLGIIEWREDHTKLNYCNNDSDGSPCNCRERLWRLDLNSMDLIVSLNEFEYAYEYVSMKQGSNELCEALDQIELMLKIYIEKAD